METKLWKEGAVLEKRRGSSRFCCPDKCPDQKQQKRRKGPGTTPGHYPLFQGQEARTQAVFTSHPQPRAKRINMNLCLIGPCAKTAFFLLHRSGPRLGNGAARSGMGQLIIQTVPHIRAHKPTCCSHSTLSLSSRVILGCIKMTVRTNKHMELVRRLRG